MNKYNIKKMLITLGLSSSMILITGCSDNKRNASPSKRIEKNMDSTDTSRPNITEEPNTTTIPEKKHETEKERKKRILKAIEKSEFDSLTKDILKSIAKDSENEITQEQLLCACTKTEKNLYGLSLYNTIVEATREQKVGIDYQLKNLKVFNNLDGHQKDLPKQIGIMECESTYGKYRFHEIVPNNFGKENFLFFITDNKNNVLLVADNKRVKKGKKLRLKNFSSLLKAYDITPQEKYSDKELNSNLIIQLSKKISEDKVDKSESIKTNDIIVLDSSKLRNSNNCDNQYCFFKYHCPYLFADNTSIYTDIFYPSTNAVFGEDGIYFYKDSKKENYTYNPLLLYGSEPNYQNLKTFLKDKNIPAKEQISYEELKEINDTVNERKNKTKVKK